MKSTTTAIAALVPRRRAVVSGEIESVVSFERPWVRTDAVLGDATGKLVLRFMGRSNVPGVVAGAHLVVRGTPAREGDILVILNPLYEFRPRDCP